MAGYSGTPLAKKLGIKERAEIYPVNAPDHYLKLVEPLPAATKVVSRLSAKTDIIHVFTASKAELTSLLKACRAKMKADGAVWVSWPKKASKVPTDITEDTIREVALPMGLVDIKVCAVDEVWSGLKLVIRKELR
jgi:hypothetical protein